MFRTTCRLMLIGSIGVSVAQANSLIDHPLSREVIDRLVSEHQFDRAEMESLFSEGEYLERNVESLANPAERTQAYHQYRPMFITDAMIENGRQFMVEQATWLAKAEAQTGVPPSVIAAIIGVETRYGGFLGQHRTFDALGTLAVTEGRRANYFQRELINFMGISRDQGFAPRSVNGSYAGAMGYPQFMPSSYLAYAVDLDEDGDIDIWNDPVDAIGSVANYLGEHGWRRGQLIATRARVSGNYQSVKMNSFDRDQHLVDVRRQGWEPLEALSDDAHVHPIRLDGDDGAEFWLGYRNFWNISRYNRSIVYTMAVYQLSEELRLAVAEEAQ
ncbi:lytic murein transglycosylase B [Saccharospirillum sp. MSK14-1]|uniref:lytic murein transglycosylase B n=1 Tax=Saccharospirillum sp. MSK14-1 TaxID=1897632 RepID=UPI000D3B898F|nr:lytic murein transglycosylase B [Saccharospirillum sp. MSK14-1]PTY38946.1 lytic murein transglycosylase B [Saccharospirillum sp. MSK14-1]